MKYQFLKTIFSESITESSIAKPKRIAVIAFAFCLPMTASGQDKAGAELPNFILLRDEITRTTQRDWLSSSMVDPTYIQDGCDQLAEELKKLVSSYDKCILNHNVDSPECVSVSTLIREKLRTTRTSGEPRVTQSDAFVWHQDLKTHTVAGDQAHETGLTDENHFIGVVDKLESVQILGSIPKPWRILWQIIPIDPSLPPPRVTAMVVDGRLRLSTQNRGIACMAQNSTLPLQFQVEILLKSNERVSSEEIRDLDEMRKRLNPAELQSRPGDYWLAMGFLIGKTIRDPNQAWSVVQLIATQFESSNGNTATPWEFDVAQYLSQATVENRIQIGGVWL